MSVAVEAGRTLVVVRHGRTAWNHERRVQGQLDPGLDDVGRQQASRVAPVLAGLRPAALWSSDLLRARETTGQLERATGLRASLDPRLREYHLGERQGLTHDEYAPAHPEEYAEFARGNFSVVPGAESPGEVGARMAAALDAVARETAPGDTSVVVSHGAAVRTGVVALLGWPDGVAGTLRSLANCGWAVLEHGWSGTGWRLRAWNRTVADAEVPDSSSSEAVG